MARCQRQATPGHAAPSAHKKQRTAAKRKRSPAERKTRSLALPPGRHGQSFKVIGPLAKVQSVVMATVHLIDLAGLRTASTKRSGFADRQLLASNRHAEVKSQRTSTRPFSNSNCRYDHEALGPHDATHFNRNCLAGSVAFGVHTCAFGARSGPAKSHYGSKRKAKSAKAPK